jgi:aryl-alcohol dehydrogenase-like predicted oxidoreductase
MRRRTLGSTGLEVSEIGFGAWQLGDDGAWSGMNDHTAHRLVNAAIDGGINLFDTAPNYASGNSERLLGEALRGKRLQVLLVSKFGHRPDGEKDFSVEWFWKSLHASLERLGTDYLDVYLLHNPDPTLYRGTDPVWDALEKARAQGKIRHFGASLDFARDAEACLQNTDSNVLEILFNVFHQDIRRAFPLVRKRGAGTIAKVPLDSGWLTGRFNACSRFSGARGRWSEEEIARRAELVDRLDWLTADGSELAHKAIGFLLSYEEVSCVIPGMRTVDQLQSNLKAAGRARDPEDRDKLEAFWDEITKNGEGLLPW